MKFQLKCGCEASEEDGIIIIEKLCHTDAIILLEKEELNYIFPLQK